MDALTERLGLLVIGSGPAGVHAATAYVEAGGPGPVCVVSADVDPPYQRPPLSKDVLAGDEPPQVTPILDDDDALAGVEVRLAARVESLDLEDRRVRTSDGHELAYERLVVATGSDPTPLPGAEPGAPVHVLRSLGDVRALVAGAEHAVSAVVVGSGFIGCEASASLARRGVRTTLVTPEPVPQAARLGDWAGSRIGAWLADLGVDVRTRLHVDAVTPTGQVRLDDGTALDVDLVLAAVGVTQGRRFLDVSGLRTSDDGHLETDEHLRTSDWRVWAAGDVAQAHHAVAGRPIPFEHWGDAMTMGRLAGRNAAADAGAGESDTWSDPPGFWSQIGEHTVKYSAWGDGYAEARVVEHGDGAFTVWYADEAGEVVGVLTHEADEDYERGGDLLARRARLSEALDPRATMSA
jgi:3-phenylpropionate/trans-cinnamate dioxygenase ferredoxin reductase component